MEVLSFGEVGRGSPILRPLAAPATQHLYQKNEALQSWPSPFVASVTSPVLASQKIVSWTTYTAPLASPAVIPADPLVRTEAPAMPVAKTVSPASKLTSQVKSGSKVSFIEDVPFSVGAETQASEELQRLLPDINALWKTVRFGGSLSNLFSSYTGLKLTIMTHAETNSLIGFLVYKINPQTNCLSIRRVAISPDFRHQGFAGQMMQWCIRHPGVAYLAATSLHKALGFYKAFGFRKVETWHSGGTAKPDDEPEHDQVYMEFHPKGNWKKAGGCKKKGKR